MHLKEHINRHKFLKKTTRVQVQIIKIRSTGDRNLEIWTMPIVERCPHPQHKNEQLQIRVPALIALTDS